MEYVAPVLAPVTFYGMGESIIARRLAPASSQVADIVGASQVTRCCTLPVHSPSGLPTGSSASFTSVTVIVRSPPEIGNGPNGPRSRRRYQARLAVVATDGVRRAGIGARYICGI